VNDGAITEEETEKASCLPKARKSMIQAAEDCVGKYFQKYTKNFVFDEFSEEFIKRTE
jgi:hypothetical protein